MSEAASLRAGAGDDPTGLGRKDLGKSALGQGPILAFSGASVSHMRPLLSSLFLSSWPSSSIPMARSLLEFTSSQRLSCFIIKLWKPPQLSLRPYGPGRRGPREHWKGTAASGPVLIFSGDNAFKANIGVSVTTRQRGVVLSYGPLVENVKPQWALPLSSRSVAPGLSVGNGIGAGLLPNPDV